MPWRTTKTPYHIWISEVMLQQTQVDTVIPYFNRFIAQFPTLQSLADADQQQILKAWEGLGYYSRARNLQKAAKQLHYDHKGQFPESYENLQKIPGIGPYIGAAVTSIAFGHPVPVVDGNVLRVFARVWGITEDIRLPKVRDEIFDALTPFIKKSNPSDFNQGIMELGALICKPKNPLCHKCPLQSHCIAFVEQRTDQLPFKSKKPPTPHHHIAVGVIWKDNQILIGKRKESQMLGGLWEFPGGKQEEGESLAQTALREIKEETGLEVEIVFPYPPIKHTYTHFKITLHAFNCRVISGEPQARSATELKWVHLKDVDQYPFPKANISLLELIKTPSAQPLSLFASV
jgi:A/G-specific adenine glycosylase